jgi:hypothetical protein
VTTFLPNGGGAGAVADFDGDGDFDIAIAEQNTGVILVYHRAAGAFTLASTISAGGNPRGLVAGDLNGDNRTDLACANRDTNNFTIALDGTAGWTSGNIAAGNDPRAVALGDINGDGDLDLAISNHDDRTVGVYANSGGGTFSLAQTLAVNPVFRPDGIAFVNAAGSNLPEVCAIISDDVVGSFVAMYANNGGTLAANATNFATLGTNSGEATAADLDRDGKVDLVVVNQDSGSISIMPNTGAGFGAAQVIATGANPERVAVGRLDGGTMPDLAVPNRDSNTTSVLLNTGTPPTPVCDSVDFNNDGSIIDPQDVDAFFSVFSEGPCIPASATCNDVDFNNDGSIFDPQDVDAFFSVFSEGPCF